MLKSKLPELLEETQKWASSDEIKSLIQYISQSQKVNQTQSVNAARFVLLYLAMRQTSTLEKKVQNLEQRLAAIEANSISPS